MKKLIFTLSMILAAGCRTGHFEKKSANVLPVEWQLIKLESKIGESKNELLVDFQIRLLFDQEAVKGRQVSAKLTKDENTVNTFKSVTTQSGIFFLRTQVNTKNWLDNDQFVWVLELSNSVFGKQQLSVPLQYSNGLLQLSAAPKKISENSKALISQAATKERDAFFQVISSAFLPRKSLSLDEEEVGWRLAGRLVDRSSGNLLRFHQLKVRIDNSEETLKETDSLGMIELEFADINRPLDHEKLRKKVITLISTGSLSPIELSVFFSTDRSRLSPVLTMDTPPLVSTNSRKQAPHLKVEILSHERIQEPDLQWSEDFFPRWTRMDELRIRPSLWRSLLEREENLGVPGLSLMTSLAAWAPENSTCRPFVRTKPAAVELSDGVLILSTRTQFDRPSCLNSNFQWVLELRPLNAPRIQSVRYLIDNQSLKVSTWEGEIVNRENWQPKKPEDIAFSEKSAIAGLVQETINTFTMPNVFEVLRSQLQTDRDLEKFMQGRSKSLQIRALKTWRWTKLNSTMAQELATSHLRLIDDQDFEKRTWKTRIIGEARRCLILVIEVIPRISRSPFFKGEKRKVRAFCLKNSEPVQPFEENLSSYTPANNNLLTPRDRLIRGFWIPEVGDGTQGTLLAEYDLLTHPELYFWGSTTDSLLIETLE